MDSMDLNINYSIGVFFIILFSGSALNLLKRHYIYQLTGIAFFHVFAIIRASRILYYNMDTTFCKIYFSLLPAFAGISACLISMVLGFWFFPLIRHKFKE